MRGSGRSSAAEGDLAQVVRAIETMVAAMAQQQTITAQQQEPWLNSIRLPWHNWKQIELQLRQPE